LVSLIVDTRQWFKARRGLDMCETPLELSFCRYAIEQCEVMVVPDATQGVCFARNPLVTGPPGIRSYAGVPLVTPDGVKLGTLCVIDTAPRQTFSAAEREMLRSLAAIVVDELELRLAKRRLEEELASHQQTQAALNARKREFKTLAENAPDIITRFDRELRHLYVNPALAKLTGLPQEAFIGKTNRELGMREEDVAFWDRELHAVFESGENRTFDFTFEGTRGLRHFQARVTPNMPRATSPPSWRWCAT
jgi:PAS domain S-box-containing protein